MDRLDFLLRGIRKDMLGIEIGPYFSPLVPKAAGYRSLSLDFMDRDGLVQRAKQDPSIAPDACDGIEEVDLVGEASELAALVERKGLTGQCDYVVSSHNFEHLPNPIRFLKECERVLKPGGLLAMAVPDRRASFDVFRPLSGTGDLLEAFHAGRACATYAQRFAFNTLHAKLDSGAFTWNVDDGFGSAAPTADFRHAFTDLEAWRAQGASEFSDVHCFVYIKASFELIVRDLHYLGVIDLGIEEMDGPEGCEFRTRLRMGLPRPARQEFQARRIELLQRVSDENGGNSRAFLSLKRSSEAQAARIDALEARLDRMRRSLGWRLTAPLRLLFDRGIG